MVESQIFVAPASAATTVADPVTGIVVPPAGAEVPNSEFWRRRIADGDFQQGVAPATGEEA